MMKVVVTTGLYRPPLSRTRSFRSYCLLRVRPQPLIVFHGTEVVAVVTLIS